MTEAVKTPYPRTFSHIGISVPDLEAAVKFYTEVLGWYLIMKPTEIVEDDSAIGEMCTDVFGPVWGLCCFRQEQKENDLLCQTREL